MVNRTETMWDLSDLLLGSTEAAAVFSKVKGKKFTVLIMTDVHFGGENMGNNGPRQEYVLLEWLKTYREQMIAQGTPELYPSFAICLGDVAEHGYEEEFIKYQAFTTLMNSDTYGNILTFNVVGNHDLYNSGWNSYVKHCYPHTSLYKFRTDSITWYFADSASGSMGDSQLETISRDMKYNEKGRKKLFFTHIPVYAGGLFYFVMQNTEERNRLISMLGDEDAIAIIDGHTHKEITSDLGFKEWNMPGFLEKRGIGLLFVDETDASNPKVSMTTVYLKA